MSDRLCSVCRLRIKAGACADNLKQVLNGNFAILVFPEEEDMNDREKRLAAAERRR